MTSMQLFCFPYAGASATVYVRWKRLLPPWIEVTPIELPGHGWRISEPLQDTMEGLVAQVESQIQPAPGRQFAFFGHSLGGLVAFECALRLQRRGVAPPCVLFASGCEAPSTPSRRERRSLSDDALRAELRRLNGTPPEVLANEELMQLALPMLRADFDVIAGYRARVRDAHEILDAPVRVLTGTTDTLDAAAVAAWQTHTRAGYAHVSFEGGHFFVHECQPEVLALVERELAQRMQRGYSPRSA